MRLTAAVSLGALLIASCTDDSPPSFERSINRLEQDSGGKIGVYALDTASGKELAYRARERFAMASTFKPLLVAAVLARVESGAINLDTEVGLDGFEVQPYSPAIDAMDDGTAMTVEQLCNAAITLGDNTATNLLLSLVDGPAGLTAFLRSHGDTTTRLDREEIELNANNPGDDRDTTTPHAMTRSLQRVLFGNVLGEQHAAMLQNWLVASSTGKSRLRAGLPDTWRVGDKSGTGRNAAVNNIAVAWPPEKAPLLIAVYMSGSSKAIPELSALHAEIAALVVATLE